MCRGTIDPVDERAGVGAGAAELLLLELAALDVSCVLGALVGCADHERLEGALRLIGKLDGPRTVL